MYVCLKLVGHVAYNGDNKSAYGVVMKKHEGKNHWECLSTYGKIILKWILKILDGNM